MGKQYSNYTLKVALPESNVSHVVSLSGSSTLEELHHLIQDAFEFADDHLYGFFMDNCPYSEDAYYAPGDEEERCADEVTLDELSLKVGRKFLYIFDFGCDWNFTIQVQRIERVDHKPVPMILESHGQNPSQYGDEIDWEISAIRSSAQPLSTFLMRFYKDDLQELCRLYCIKYKTAWNKTQLTEALLHSWTQDPECMLRVYSQDEIAYLLDIWECTPVEANIETLVRFQEKGLLDIQLDGERIDIQYCEEGKALFQPYLQSCGGEAKRNWYAEIEALTMGYMWCYGVVEEDLLFSKVRQYMKTELDAEQYQLFLWQRYLWGGSLHQYIDPDSGTEFISYVDSEKLYGEILEARVQHQVEYREFTKKEVLDYYYTAGIGSLDLVQEFHQFMADSVFQDEEEAHEFVAFTLGMLKGGVPLPDIVEEVVPPAAEIGSKKRKQAIHFLQNINATLPDYRYKGYTPNEIRLLESNLQVICGGQVGKKK